MRTHASIASRLWFAGILALPLAACPEPPEGIDAGDVESDAGSVESDAGNVGNDAGDVGNDAGDVESDAGAPDAGSGDVLDAGAGEADAGETDAGPVADAGPIVDAGGFIDAGEPDAGLLDGGELDAGLVDAGAPDAGAPDAGAPDAGPLARAPAPGDLVITEILHTPSAGVTAYLELYNLSGEPLALAGLTLTDTPSGETFTLPAGAAPLEAGGYLVLAHNVDPATNGGVEADLALPSGFPLANTGELELHVDGERVERVVWGMGFPQTPGRAMQLSSVALHDDANLLPWYWCDSDQALQGGDFGTPGAPNGDCGVPWSPPVEWCNVQWPRSDDWGGTRAAPLSHDVYSQVYESDVTTRNQSGPDFYPNLEAELGFGSDANDLESWTWTPGAHNAGFGGGNNDEMVATLEIATPGTWYYGWRYRFLDPVTRQPEPWTYCDENGVVAAPASGTWGRVIVE